MIYTRFYNGEKLPFHRAEALRYFGCGKGANNLSKELEELFDGCAKEALAACSYQVCYTEFPIRRERRREGAELDLGFTRTDSHSLAVNLRGCDAVLIFAATVGVGIDRLIARSSAESTVKAYAFQAIGAERIETLCDFFNEEIRREYAAKGFFIRPRFSCGYGDFPLEKQRDFFTALDCSRKIGVTLNDSLLMSPSKSVTALIGYGKTASRKSFGGCEHCTLKDCSFRKDKKETKDGGGR